MSYQITTQKELRAAFWRDHPNESREMIIDRQLSDYRHGKTYKVDTRVAWCDYIDALCRDGVISEALASRATL